MPPYLSGQLFLPREKKWQERASDLVRLQGFPPLVKAAHLPSSFNPYGVLPRTDLDREGEGETLFSQAIPCRLGFFISACWVHMQATAQSLGVTRDSEGPLPGQPDHRGV